MTRHFSSHMSEIRSSMSSSLELSNVKIARLHEVYKQKPLAVLVWHVFSCDSKWLLSWPRSQLRFSPPIEYVSHPIIIHAVRCSLRLTPHNASRERERPLKFPFGVRPSVRSKERRERASCCLKQWLATRQTCAEWLFSMHFWRVDNQRFVAMFISLRELSNKMGPRLRDFVLHGQRDPESRNLPIIIGY